MRSLCGLGESAWNAVRCVATDGGNCFASVLESLLPGVPHLLCLYHIQANLKKHLRRKMGAKWDAFSKQFRTCAYNVNTAEQFESSWTSLLTSYPAAVDYLSSQWYPKRQKWSSAWTLQYCTFGARSTQRVESINRIIKHFVPAGSSMQQLFDELIRIFDLQRQRLRQRMDDDEFTNHKHNGAVYRDTVRFLTKQAAEKVHEQSAELPNYSACYYPAHPSSIDIDKSSSSVPRASSEVSSSVAFTVDAHGSNRGSDGYLVRLRGADTHVAHWVRVDDNSATCADCDFAQNMLLPCRHILCANLIRWPELSAFHPRQVHPRWKKDPEPISRAGGIANLESADMRLEDTHRVDDGMVNDMEDSGFVIEPSSDALYIRFMAKAQRLAQFLKPWGEERFKRVEAWMEHLIQSYSAEPSGTDTDHVRDNLPLTYSNTRFSRVLYAFVTYRSRVVHAPSTRFSCVVCGFNFQSASSSLQAPSTAQPIPTIPTLSVTESRAINLANADPPRLVNKGGISNRCTNDTSRNTASSKAKRKRKRLPTTLLAQTQWSVENSGHCHPAPHSHRTVIILSRPHPPPHPRPSVLPLPSSSCPFCPFSARARSSQPLRLPTAVSVPQTHDPSFVS